MMEIFVERGNIWDFGSLGKSCIVHTEIFDVLVDGVLTSLKLGHSNILLCKIIEFSYNFGKTSQV